MFSTTSRFSLLATILITCSVSASFAQFTGAPDSVSFQGFLTDDQGEAISSLTDITISLFTAPAGGSQVWSRAYTNVPVNNGIFNLVLAGGTTDLSEVAFDQSLWVHVEVEGENQSPRAPLTSAPYALGLRNLRVIPETGSDGPTLIGGFSGNSISASVSGATIAGGGDPPSSPNTVTGDYGTVGGGQGNSAHSWAVVGGGLFNGAGATYSAIAGGRSNEAIGLAATVPGGWRNIATGDYSFAAGYRALASHEGTFVWNDRSETADNFGANFESTGGNQFLIRAEGGVGIGTNAPEGQLHVSDIPATGNGNLLSAYVATVENTSTGSSADGLAIRIGTTGDPGSAANLIGFFDGDSGIIGQIEGNSSGGVAYTTSGSDYAEYLPLLDGERLLEPGDVVGVFNGKISHRTTGSDQIFAVTGRPAVIGNMPENAEETDGYETVSFIGQVPVKVRGPVTSGDYLLASGREDGTARAVSADEIRPEQVTLLVGRAWEDAPESGLKRVNAAVGLDRTEVLIGIIQRQQRQIDTLRDAVEALVSTTYDPPSSEITGASLPDERLEQKQ